MVLLGSSEFILFPYSPGFGYYFRAASRPIISIIIFVKKLKNPTAKVTVTNISYNINVFFIKSFLLALLKIQYLLKLTVLAIFIRLSFKRTVNTAGYFNTCSTLNYRQIFRLAKRVRFATAY